MGGAVPGVRLLSDVGGGLFGGRQWHFGALGPGGRADELVYAQRQRRGIERGAAQTLWWALRAWLVHPKASA